MIRIMDICGAGGKYKDIQVYEPHKVPEGLEMVQVMLNEDDFAEYAIYTDKNGKFFAEPTMTKDGLKEWAFGEESVMLGSYEDLIRVVDTFFPEHSNFFQNWKKYISDDDVKNAIDRSGWEKVVEVMNNNYAETDYYIINPTDGIPMDMYSYYGVETDFMWNSEKYDADVELWHKIVNDLLDSIKE